MAVSALMGIASQALAASYRQVHTVGNNIANANTEGYSRQSVIQSPSLSLKTNGGFVGTGVTVVSLERASNLFLQEKTATLTATAAGDQTLSDMLGQLELVFGKGEAGIGNAATQVFSAFADLAVTPSDLSARQAVIGRLEDFASLARANGAQLQMLQDNVRSDLGGAVSQLNSMARQVATLNVQIQNAIAVGDAPNDLLDRRDLLVRQMAEQVDLQSYTYADGGMGVFVAGGQPLVLGNEFNELLAERDPLDSTRSIVNISIQGETTLLAGERITGGRIGGLLEFQNDDLMAARSRLGQLVTSVAMTMNAQQALGLDLYGDTGAPIFDIPVPLAMAHADNARGPDRNPIASIALQVVDPKALEASDYELRADPSAVGTYVLTRLSDGLVRSGIASGDVVDGLMISNGPNVPQPGERFLLRAVAHVPLAVQITLRDPRAIAAASPVTVALDADNRGSLALVGLDAVSAPASPYASMTLRFTDEAGNYELLDAGGGVMASGQFIAGQPIEIEGLSLKLAGVPKTDDRILLEPTLHVGSHNGNALTFAAMAEQMIVNRQRVGDAYANLMADQGVRAQSAKIAADNSSVAAGRAAEALAAETGVNIDEEAARLIQYQQTYQAAAKVMQTAQTLIDTVLNLRS